MRVEVVYLAPGSQHLVAVEVAEGATLADAIAASGLAGRVPGLVVDDAHVGVYGDRRTLADAVAPGDRVEIYRSLIADAKAARRERARRDPIKRK